MVHIIIFKNIRWKVSDLTFRKVEISQGITHKICKIKKNEHQNQYQ